MFTNNHQTTPLEKLNQPNLFSFINIIFFFSIFLLLQTPVVNVKIKENYERNGKCALNMCFRHNKTRRPTEKYLVDSFCSTYHLRVYWCWDFCSRQPVSWLLLTESFLQTFLFGCTCGSPWLFSFVWLGKSRGRYSYSFRFFFYSIRFYLCFILTPRIVYMCFFLFLGIRLMSL